jgi:hypothetical protein
MLKQVPNFQQQPGSNSSNQSEAAAPRKQHLETEGTTVANKLQRPNDESGISMQLEQNEGTGGEYTFGLASPVNK